MDGTEKKCHVKAKNLLKISAGADGISVGSKMKAPSIDDSSYVDGCSVSGSSAQAQSRVDGGGKVVAGGGGSSKTTASSRRTSSSSSSSNRSQPNAGAFVTVSDINTAEKRKRSFGMSASSEAASSVHVRRGGTHSIAGNKKRRRGDAAVPAGLPPPATAAAAASASKRSRNARVDAQGRLLVVKAAGVPQPASPSRVPLNLGPPSPISLSFGPSQLHRAGAGAGAGAAPTRLAFADPENNAARHDGGVGTSAAAAAAGGVQLTATQVAMGSGPMGFGEMGLTRRKKKKNNRNSKR